MFYPSEKTELHFYPLLVRTINSSDKVLVRRLLRSYSSQPTLLFTLLSSCTEDIFVEICYCLSALKHRITLQSQHMAGLLEKCGTKKGCYFVKLLIVLFEGCDAALRREILQHASSFLGVLAERRDTWAMYCIARVAMCNGVFEIGLEVVLKVAASHPYTQYFFSSLELVCRGELSESLQEAIELYSRAVTTGKCCRNSALTHFQTDFLLLRLRLLKIYLQLVNLSKQAKMCVTDSTSSYRPTLRFIAQQVEDLETSVRELEARMIDARPRDNLKETLLICNILSILTTGVASNPVTKLPPSPTSTECSRTLAVIRNKPQSLHSVAFLRQTVERLTALRFSLPLFYFIQEHSTSISLATSPAIEQGGTEQGIIKIAGGCRLLLTVEAVVRGNTSRIHHILVAVSCDKSKSARGKEEEDVSLFDREVRVVEGYLKLELELEVQSYADVYTIHARAVDANQTVWDVGSKVNFRVKTDDSVLSKSQMSKAYV